jgi:hypothetical protein
MKKIMVAVLLSLFIMSGSAIAKKFEILVRYEKGTITPVENNCTSSKGKLKSTKTIRDGEAVIRSSSHNPNDPRGKLRSLNNKGEVVDEVEISFHGMTIISEQSNGEELSGSSKPVENMVFVAEIPYQEGVDAIEIVNDYMKAATVNTIPISEFVDESGRVQLLSDPCDLDIVILPEWYELNQAGANKFNGNVNSIIEKYITTPPYSDFADKINFYRPFYPEQMTLQDTQILEEVVVIDGVPTVKISYYPFGNECIWCHANQITPDYDEIYILIDTEDLEVKRAGASLWECAYPDTPISEGRLTYSFGTNHPTKGFLFIHEMGGHSGPHLRDEYVYPLNNGEPWMNPYPNECSEDNCCETCDHIIYADCNKNGWVDLYDLIIMIFEYARWNCNIIPCLCDCNGDGKVDIHDLLLMKTEFMESACYWDLEPGCEGCQEGCTWGNYYHCCQCSCIMHQASGVDFCPRCTDMITTWLQQCH